MKDNAGLLDFSNYPSELPIYALRPEIQGIIQHYSEVFQCPQDFVASAVLVIASTLCGKHVTILNGGYANNPNLWLCHIAPSGSNKSAPVKALLQPLMKEEGIRFREYKEQCKAFSKNSNEEEPKLVQRVASDVTPEAAYMLLCDHNDDKDGLLLYRDEIKGFIDDIGRYHKSGEVSNYLSIYDGTSFYVTRKTQPPLFVEEPFLSMLGGIQPEVFGDAFSIPLTQAGFTARWLFVYPNMTIEEPYADRSINPYYSTAWNEVIKKLESIDNMELTLDNEAKKMHANFYNLISAKKIVSNPIAVSMLSKLRIQLLKWCAVAHILSSDESSGAGQVFALPSSNIITGEEMRYSIDCMQYFEYSGRKALNLVQGVQPKKKETQAEMIANLIYNIGVEKVNITKFAEGIGVSRQYVSKIINRDPRLRGCTGNLSRSPPNTSNESPNGAQSKYDNNNINVNRDVAV